jgi:GNAT superfamily N-acetyltransferase
VITYERSSLSDNQLYLDDDVAGIAIPYDDFLEEHILQSAIYSLFYQGEHIGFCGVGEQRVNIFFVRHDRFRLANEIFADVKAQFDIHEAFVPTTDLGFLSVALEQYSRIEIQALHFTETPAVIRPPKFARDHFRLATESDVPAVEQLAGDFLDRYAERISQQQIYLLEEDREPIGLGVLTENILMPNCVGTGMFTREDRRGQGIGRSIIIHLQAIAHELGKTPVPGCWYHNVNSRKTLESAGYVSKSKLLRFHF